MKDWRKVTESQGVDRPVTTIELVEDKLPAPLNTKQEHEEYKILYPAATADSVYQLSVFRDDDERLTCTQFHVAAVGTDKQEAPEVVETDSDGTLRATFRLIKAYLDGNDYVMNASERDIVLKVLPLASTREEIIQLSNELKAQLAIDLL